MPDRVVKEYISGSDSLSQCSLLADLFWPRFLTIMDDHGCFDARPAIIKSKLFPLRDDVTAEVIENWLIEYQQADLVTMHGRYGRLKRRPQPLPTNWRALRMFIFERDEFTCRYCGATNVLFECDHVIPRSRGGSNDPSNLATACVGCNRGKT